MKWTALPIAGLLALMMAVPSVAQEAKKEDTKDTTSEARTVLLKQKSTKDLKITSEGGAVTNESVALAANGMVVQSKVEAEHEMQVTEILEVAEDGSVTKMRVRWTHIKTETVVSRMNQQGQLVEGEPEVAEGDHKGASILHTWNAEKKAWENTLEKGDKDASEVKKQLARKDPTANPMIPNREVKVGEEWKADEAAMKEFFASGDDATLVKAAGTLKAKEIIEREGVEYLIVSFTLEMTIEVGEEGAKHEVPFTNKGEYAFNIKESRVVRVEMKSEAKVETSVDDPNMGKIDLDVNIDAERVIQDHVGKVGDKDLEPSKAEEEEEEEEGGMDG